MKKVILLTAVAIAVTTMSSCRKDYSCTCKLSLLGTTQEIIKVEAKSTKKSAEAWCDAYQKELTEQIGIAPTCELE